MKKFLSEFKEFALRGNVFDLAVGVIIGGAFQSIVTALIDNLLMPFIGLLTGGVSFVDQFVVLKLAEGVAEGTKYASLSEAQAAGATVFAYGAFISAVINFIIMAFVIFLMVKAMNKVSSLHKKQEETVEEVTTKVCPYCKSEISKDATRCPHCTSELDK